MKSAGSVHMETHVYGERRGRRGGGGNPIIDGEATEIDGNEPSKD